MQLSKLEIFFGRFSIYIIGFFVVLSIVLGTGWYVSNIKLDGQVAKANAIAQRLTVTTASYNSIRDEFGRLTGQLQANQEKALASHAILQSRLTEIVNADKSRIALEQSLLNRTPGQACTTPKDLQDAWNHM